jgi:molecular chaperone Hsp33
MGSMSENHDILSRFLFEDSGIRGELVHLDGAWQTSIRGRDYPAPVRAVLGESLAAVALLAATIKIDGKLTLQAAGDGPLNLLVVEATSQRTLRAVARFTDAAHAPRPLSEMLGQARLAMTVDPGEGRERYQGIVDSRGATIAEHLEGYFARSEQLPTRLWLAADDTRAAGLLLQRVPAETPGATTEEADEAWAHSVVVAETVRREELLDLDRETLLRRLFHDRRVRLFSPERWGFHCKCSRERVGTMLQALGRDEAQATLAAEGSVGVTCDFCGEIYEFDAVDVAALFTETAERAPGWAM